MAYTQLTPQERMQRAAQLRAMREARLGYTPTDDSLSRYLLPTEKSVGVEPVQPVQSAKPAQQSGEGFDLGRVGATALDIGSKIVKVPGQMLEQIFDLGASLVGNVGGWFSEEFEREVANIVEYNATNEWIGKPLDDLGLSHSYLNEEGAGEFFDSIFDGVAQVGTVAALSLIPGFGTAAAIGTMGASAAGGGVQEALADGADLGAATNYGIVTGAIEGGTEALLGGVPVFGKGVKAIGKEVAEQGGKRILKGMVEEGIEEGLATAVNPLAKTLYKGGEALYEYTDPEFYGQILQDAAAGAAVSGAFEFSVGRATHQTGKDADISAAQDSIKELTKKRRKLQASEEGLTDEADAKIVESGRKNLENISNVLKNASPKQREALIKRHRLDTLVDAEGNLKTDFAAKAFGQANTAPDPQTGRVEEGQSADGRYYSADMRGREDVLQKDAEYIQEALRAKPNQENATVELFRGELSEEGKKHLRETYGAMNTLSDLTPTGMSIALVDSDGGMDGVVLGNRIYLDYRTIEDGTFAKPLVEEVSHFSEGTETYADAIKFISEDNVLRQGVYDALTGDGNFYGFTTELADRTIEKQKNREKLTDEESTFARELNAHMSAEALGNETFMKKLVRGKPKLAEKLIARIKALQAALSKSETPEARTQRKRLAKAEKLWLEAVEDAGAKEMMKYFGANKEEEETLDNASATEYNGGAQFSRSNHYTNEFKTNAMQWAFSAGTKRGDVKVFYDPSDNTWKKLVADDSGEGFDVLDSVEVTEENADKIHRMIKEEYRDNNGSKQGEGALLYSNIKGYRSGTRSGGDDHSTAQLYRADGQDGRSDRGESQNNRSKASRQGIGVSSRSISYLRGEREVVFQTMDKSSCKKLVDRAFALAKRYGDVTEGQYKNSDEWIRDVGAFNAALILEETDEYRSGAKKEVASLKDGDVSLSEVFQAYIDGELVGNSVYNTLQFSLPAKPQSAGARAKSNANRSRSKTFTREDAALIAEAVVDESTVFAGEDGGMYRSKFQGKVKLIDRLWVRLNEIEDQRSRDIYADKLADSIIAHTVVTLSADDPTMEAMTDRVKALKGYFRKLDLSSIKGDLKHARGGEKGALLALYSRWHRNDGKGMTPDQIVEELRGRGVVIDAENPADILLEMDRMYTEALDAIAQNSNILLDQFLSDADLAEYRKHLKQKILEATKDKGSRSKLAREYYDDAQKLRAEYDKSVEHLAKVNEANYQAMQEAIAKNDEQRKKELEKSLAAVTEQANARMEKAREKYEAAREKHAEQMKMFRAKMRAEVGRLEEKIKTQEKSAKLVRDIVFQAEMFKKMNIGKSHYVSEFDAPVFRKALGVLSKITRGGQLSASKVRDAFNDLLQWDGLKIIQEMDAEGRFNAEDLKLRIERLAGIDMSRDATGLDPSVPLTVDELHDIIIVMKALRNYVENVNKIRRNGKLVDALPIVEEDLKNIERANRIPRGITRKFYESGFMSGIADPATLMRYADLYHNGFFTETYESFREAAVKVAVTRMELTEPYDKWMEEHDKYVDRLVETIDFRGRKLTVRTAVALWMTSKRRQAWRGLVESGFSYDLDIKDKDAKKAANGQKTFTVPPLDPDIRAKIEEAKNAAKAAKQEFTDEDIAKLLEPYMKDLRADIEKSLTAEDLEYIKMVEGIFDECGDIKMDVDFERLGYTNVDTDQYYFPIVRADQALTIDSEGWRQGLDRVSHLSMNKDTVKGASSRLFIGGVDSILMRHITQVSLYNGLSEAVDNFNVLMNLSVSGNRGAPINVQTEASRTDFGKEAIRYLQKLKQDIEEQNRIELDDHGRTKMLSTIRGHYATATLGANPKTWVTQLSSFIAATNVLDADSITKGAALKMGKDANGVPDVEKYCPLAKLRRKENVAYEAQSVSAKVTNKVSEVLMKPIGFMDRVVINRLWGGCQVQIEKEGGAKVGTFENKKAAGKLLQKVILETQQNSLATERSSLMRSQNEIFRMITMFSADAMKTVGRVFDAFGEMQAIRAELKYGKLTDAEREALEARRKKVHGKLLRSVTALVASAVFMAVVAQAFRALLAQDDDKEPEEIAGQMIADGVGNLFGGIPLARDVYGFLAQGYEVDGYLFSTVNDLLSSFGDTLTFASDSLRGRSTMQQGTSAVRKLFYSAGSIFGLPTKNVYKYATGLTKRIFPDAGYAIDAFFTHKPYAADLKKAIEADDPRMIAMIASLATGENYGIYSDNARAELQKLVAAGYTVFPRTVGETVTVDGETMELTGAQKTRFEKVYRISDQAVEALVSLKQFKEASEKERATALKFIYDTYYAVAIDDLLGTDTEEKRVLFAEILDIEKLAMILSHVSTLTADKDKSGKTVSGSRKQKITAYISKLNLTAAEKYMVMGYLGYTNVNGKNQVESLINRSSLSRTEKQKLLAYSGY